MKKLATLISSLLIFAGVKAQTVPVKKETTKTSVQVNPGPTQKQLKSAMQDTKVMKMNKATSSGTNVLKSESKVNKLNAAQMKQTSPIMKEVKN